MNAAARIAGAQYLLDLEASEVRRMTKGEQEFLGRFSKLNPVEKSTLNSLLTVMADRRKKPPQATPAAQAAP